VAKFVPEVEPQKDGIFNFSNWIAGITLIYTTLFGVGKVILGNPVLGVILIAIGIASGVFIYWNMNKKGWQFFSN
jgi:urea transporter